MRTSVVLLLFAIAACGGGERSANDAPGNSAPPADTAPSTSTSEQPASTAVPLPELPDRSVLTYEDAGQSYTLLLGNRVELQLSNDWSWTGPFLVGPAELVPVNFVQDPGYTAWELLIFEPGIVAITSRGEPNCDDPDRCPAIDYSVSIDVVGHEG